MNNQVLSALMADYARRREENSREESRRQQEIRDHYPAIADLAEQRHEMVMRSVRMGLRGTLEDPEAQMEAFNRQISDLLEKAGLPRDYLAPVCQCPLCRDTGYVYVHSVQKPCVCLENAYRKAMTEAGEDLLEEQTFERFDLSRFPEEPLPGTDVTQREYMRLMRDKCRAFADAVPQGGKRTLLLHGASGLGKTYLLNCIGHAVRARGVEVIYTTAYDLFLRLKNAYFSRTGEDAQEYFDVPLLLIDDLGMEPLMEGITVEQMYHLLNSRMTRGVYTAISTNLSRVELKEKYTERVSSRLLDTHTGLVLPFLGKDIRLLRS